MKNLTLSKLAVILGSLMLLALVQFNNTGSASSWYNPSFSYRKPITIDRTKVSGGTNLTNFPVLISTTDPDLKTIPFGGKAASGSGEFVFTSSDGTTLINHEIEKYDPSTGQFIGWVKVPTVSATIDTTLYIYYGGPAAGGATNQNKNGVWDANYIGVWHLKETVTNETTASGSYQDSTSNNNVGGQIGTDDVVGKIGTGQAFDGSDYVSVNPASNAEISTITISAWVYQTAAVTDRAVSIGTGTTDHYQFGVLGGNRPFFISRWTTTNGVWEGTLGTFTQNQWGYLTATYNRTTTTNDVIQYINGVALSNTAKDINPVGNPLLGANKIKIGANMGTAGDWNGNIDEVRISNSIRSPGWIQTEYANQNSPGTFYTIYPEESSIPTPTPPPDTTPPVISNVNASNIASTSANINWNTDEPSNSQIQFLGNCPSTGCLTPLIPTLVTSHTIGVPALTPATTYVFQVLSRDTAGNLATSATNSFTTLLPPVVIAIAQFLVVDGDIPGNLARVAQYAQQAASSSANILILPELVDVGFGPIVTAPTGGELAEPIPGPTSNTLSAIAKQNNIWISAAILEEVPEGGYDTNVLISNIGKLVSKQRKAFVYPVFGGSVSYQGNYHDAIVMPTPWGRIGIMNCADLGSKAKRDFISRQKPDIIVGNSANPDRSYINNYGGILAAECNCFFAGSNMVFPTGTPGGTGGGGKVISPSGTVLWQGGSGVEQLGIVSLDLNPINNNNPPKASAGEIQTVQLPTNSVTLNGFASDDNLPNGTLTTTWSYVSGPGGAVFSNPNALTTNVTLNNPGVHIVKLMASDGQWSQSDEVSINVLPASGSDPNLVGYWTFNSTANDSSGYNNNGTIFGNPTYVTSSTDVAPIGSPNPGAINLDGNGDYVQVAHNATLNAVDGVTMAFWIKPRSYPSLIKPANFTQIINKGNTWGSQNYMAGFGGYFYLHSDSMDMRIPSLDDAIRTPNQWYHVAVSIDPHKNQGKIYFNGVLDHTVYNVGKINFTNIDPLFIGTGKTGASTINGLLDDVKLYTRILTDTEVKNLVPNAIPNVAPTTNAGFDITTTLVAGASLSGSYSDDGWPATSNTAKWIKWQKVSGPGSVSFSNLYSLTSTATFSQTGTYVLELLGSDGTHLNSDQVVITVN